MIPEREPQSNHYADKIEKFFELDSVGGISKFALRKPKIERVEDHTFIALIKNVDQNDGSFVLAFFSSEGRSPIDIIAVLKRIKDLGIPSEVLALGIKDEADGNFSKALFEEKGLPIAILALGGDEGTPTEAITLFTLPGISAQASLSRVKGVVNEAMIGFN